VFFVGLLGSGNGRTEVFCGAFGYLFSLMFMEQRGLVEWLENSMLIIHTNGLHYSVYFKSCSFGCYRIALD